MTSTSHIMSCKLNLDEKKNVIGNTWQWLHLSHASIRMDPWDWGTGVMGTTGACVWESWGEDRGHGWVKTCWIKGIRGHLVNVGHVVLSCYCPQYVTHSQTWRKPNTYVISPWMMFRLTFGTQTTFKSSILKLLQNVITNK